MAHINLIPGEQGVRLSTLSPKYLHTNSTSHTWPFSAIAELIDNAYDPDVDASQLWIDIERYGFEQCLTFTDNGAGMDSLKLHKMLSFGFCEKVAKNDHLPVGHYGNGFKSGSMRLGKDAIVFTKHKESRSVGFLSQTYLETVKAQTILVPIVSWDAEDNMVERSDGDRALQDILKYSLFRSNVDIMGQFNKIKSLTGTRIVINNMRRTQEGKYEFDFKTYYNDIRIPDDVELDSYKYKRQERQYHIPESDYSLRAYCSILYLKPRMQIMLRGSKVKTTVIAKSLSKTEVDTYKPQGVARPIKVTFGFSQNKNHYGIMMYHRNRLIKPYVRVGYQLKANNLGVGVIGVIQCDYLQPTHNKQDFDYTKAYRSSMSALGSKLNDYWNEKKGRLHANSTAAIPEPKEVESRPDQLWVQCDNPECLKWRKLPHGISPESLPEKWYCTDHPEERWRSCDVPEELEEEAEESVQPYVKKQKKRLEKELEEKKKREKEAKRLKELELEVKAKELKKKEAEIKKLIQIVENKSKEQQQQQQRGAVKKETASPQKLQIKVVGPAVQRQQQTTPTKKIVVQNSNSKVILSPLSTSQTLTVKTPTSVSPMTQTPGTPTRTIFKKPETATQSVQLVKVMSGNPPQITNQKNPLVINLGKVTVAQPGMAPKVSGPPVVLKVNSKAAAEQVQYLPTMVPVTAVVDPKVVSVQSLANARQQTGATNILIKASATNTPINVAMPTNVTIKATPGASMATPGAAPMVAPGIAMVTSKAAVTTSGPVMATPGNSMATGTAMAIPGNSMATQVNNQSNGQQLPLTYQPLESLKKVNEQATENTVSPVTAVIEDTTPDYSNAPKTVQTNTTPLGHQDVTVNNRYRYIAPTGQPLPQGAQCSAAASPLPMVPQQVKTETETTNSNRTFPQQPVIKTESQSQQKSSTNEQTVRPSVKEEPTRPSATSLKRKHDQTSDDSPAAKQKKEADIIIIDPPSPPPLSPVSSIGDTFRDLPDISMDGSLPNMDSNLPNMNSNLPNMDTNLPNMDSSLPNMDSNLPNMDTSSTKKEKQEVDKLIKDCKMVNIDKDVVDEVKAMSPMEQLQALLTRTQQLKQLYSLRENVLKLLRVLVPELDVTDDLKNKYEDQTVDELLKQVLEQAEKTDADGMDS